MGQPQTAENHCLISGETDYAALRSELDGERRQIEAERWQLETERRQIEAERWQLETERRQIEAERRQLEADKLSLLERRKLEEDQGRQQKHLFEMKWKILEEELFKLASERQQLEIQKAQFSYDQQESFGAMPMMHGGEMFFSGVDNEQGMRKRYKELIKIYHPDNADGDTVTLQAINQEYDELKKQFCG